MSLIAAYLERHSAGIEALEHLAPVIESTGNQISAAIQNDNKVLLCGNGGSAADSQHIAAELVGRFVKDRRGLPAMALTTDTSILTAVANDYGYEKVFARQVEAHAREGDLLIAISTSGNSSNVLAAVEVAKELGCQTVGLLGRDGGKLKSVVDQALVVSIQETAHIQECHIVIGHIWCAIVDAKFANSSE